MKKTILASILIISSIYCFAQTSDTTEKNNQNSPSVLQKIETWYGENMNYWSITALMTIESSFIPFPSEIVIPPAVYVAGHENSSLNVTESYTINVLLIILFGTLGALIGAIINYALAIWLGRPIVYKFANSKVGHLLLLSSEKIQKAEEYFNEHGKISTFIGRLIPGIRQLISIPAGLARMNFWSFLGFTALGAGAWNIILAALGYIAHGQADLINQYSHELSIVIITLFGIAVIWLVIRKLRKRNSNAA